MIWEETDFSRFRIIQHTSDCKMQQRMLFGAEQKTQPTSQKVRPDELSDDSNSIIPQQITMKIRVICMNALKN